MGASVSVTNDTNVPLAVTLSQVGPLHYQNVLEPGKTHTFECGAVWFTLTAHVNLARDEIFSNWSVAKPIAMATAAAIIGALTGGLGPTVAGLAAMGAVSLPPAAIASLAAAGGGLYAAGK